MPLDLNQLRMFHQVARHGSFTRAGAHLHVSQSAVSHGVARLERGLATDLVDRRGRRFTLTAEGRYLHQVCERVFAELDEAEERLTAGSPPGGLRIRFGAPVEFGTTVLIDRLAALRRAHPKLHIDFHLSNHLADSLQRDEVDLVLDCKPHRQPDLLTHRLFREKYLVLAAPSLLEQHTLTHPTDLARVPVISLDRELTWWTNLLSALPAEERPLLRHVVVVTHVRGMINAAGQGYGVALVPKYTVMGELAAGTLVELFPGLNLLEDEFRLYQKRNRADREANRLLTDFLVNLGTDAFGDSIAPVEP